MLVSVGTMDCAGWSLLVKGEKCVIQSPKYSIVGQVPLVRELYRIHETHKSTNSHITMAASRTMTINKLYCKMGHVNHKDLRHMIKQGMVTGINLDLSSKAELCEPCIHQEKPKCTIVHQ